MIDLHCHLLPGIDDGAVDMDMSIAMARMAVADGITHVACTPHIMPGVFDNSAGSIYALLAALESRLEAAGIPLVLVVGADNYLVPDFPGRLAGQLALPLNQTRYFLFEPPHDVAPPGIEHAVNQSVTAGYTPLITHPERLTWLDGHYKMLQRLSAAGALIQITAGSITGRFGRRPKYWADRLLEEGRVDIIATDAHNLTSRPPVLSEARDVIAQRLGEAEAWRMVYETPAAILNNVEMERQPKGILPQSSLRPPRSTSRILQWLRQVR